jgi:L-cysteine S-thiosulfotransferase
MKKISITLAALLLAGCAGYPAGPEGKLRYAIDSMKRDFQAKGIAGMDRLDLDTLVQTCNQTNNKPKPDVAEALEVEQAAAIRLPADGKYMGDWKEGEKLAQSGRGMTWSDKAGQPNGGNCYNCHRISKKEISFGTIGPSLVGYGKLKGTGVEAQKNAYAQIYNSKAFNACSAMPRFGHVGALDEKQIKDLVALLLDPESPVNK